MTTTLAVTARDTKENLATLRTNGNVPGVVYGPKQEPIAISVGEKDFGKILETAGESTIIELTGLPETLEVLIKNVDFDPIKRAVSHFDLYAIERGKEMTTTVPLEFIGDAPAEKANIGTVTKTQQDVEVTCRPSNLPSQIEVDVSSLVDESSKITIADIKAPEGVTINNDPEDPVAVISVAKEEVEEAPAAVDMDAIEVEEKGKAEEGGEEGGEEKAE